jgi:tetratricopeptide (TPR) repeat protein
MSSPQELAALAWSYFQAGALESAEELYRQSVAADPSFADGWVFLAIVQKARGDLNGAAESYRKALSLRPDYFEALNNLGNILVAQGTYEEAADFIRRALTIQPKHPLALNNLGACLRHLGQFDEAIGCYRQALQLKPNYADAHNNLGDALSRQGNWAEAVSSYGEALRLRPDFAEAHNNLGVSLAKLGRTNEAVAEYREALRLNPNYAEAYLNLGNVQAAAKKTDEAIASYQHALRLNPRLAEAHYNIGVALAEQDKIEEAIAYYRQALEIKPNYLDAMANLGHALRAQGKLDEALATYEQLVQQSPDSPEAHMSRALVWLLLGDYERGWPEYEWRWKTKEFAGTARPQPRWDGSPLEGRTIAVTAEQGLGDIIQFVRYAAAVKARGGKVVVTCPRSLMTLLATCPGIDQLVPREEPLPPADVYASLLSLPAILGTTLATIPRNVPYLSANPELVEKWRSELADLPGFKIGIAWQGNPQFRGDRQRSVPLSCFEPLAKMNGVHLVSLQKGAGSEQLAEVADRFSVTELGTRLDTGGDAFVDTAAVLKSLDLVITINSSLAHVAGALAAPTWIALGRGSFDWRWLLDRNDSPWYPTVRLFHQQKAGDWTEVMERIAAEIAKLRPPLQAAGGQA